jgi:hypothetical protein
MDHAISRARARRRQIKPPHPLWVFALGLTVMAAVNLIGVSFDMPGLGASISILSSLLQITAWWPVVMSKPDNPKWISPIGFVMVIVAFPLSVLGWLLP